MRIHRTALATLSLAGFIAFAGCNNSPTTPTQIAFSQTDLRAGAGAEAVSGKVLKVNYTGWLYDPSKPDQKGLIFDSSIGRDTFAFTLGAGQVIKGWDEGLVGLRVGGLRKLVIPSSMAYGGVRTFAIPPYATLLFEVELLDVSDPQ
jgi:FKBP-type peptidyl-prolyl cis-trans isomerase